MTVVAYDIHDDRRRMKLHRILRDYGTPVQFSVFECWLTRKREDELLKKVRKVIRPRKDHVRFYHLCASCSRRVETTQAGEITRNQDVIVV